MLRHILLTIALSLATSLATLAVYHHTLERERIARETHIAQNASAHAARIQQEKERQAIARALQMERVRHGVAAAAGIQTELAIFLAEHGTLPDSLEELHYPPHWTPSNLLQSVQLMPDGTISLHFAAQSTVTGSVQLTPDIDRQMMMIRGWQCASGDIAFIADAIPSCHHQ